MIVKEIVNPTTKEVEDMQDLVEICHQADGSFSQPYLATTYNVDRSMPAFLLAYEAENLVAFAYLYADEPHEAEVSLYVRPSHRRQGLMTSLLEKLDDLAARYVLTDLEFVTEKVFLASQPDFCANCQLSLLDGSEIWLTQTSKRYDDLEENPALALKQADASMIEEIASFQSEAFADDIKTARLYAQQSVENPATLLYVLSYKERLIGSATVDSSDKVNHLFGLAIDEKYQGQGFGTYLMKSLINDLQEKNNWDFQIVVEEENQAARKLYGKLGFVERTEVVYLKKDNLPV
ncbi:GNAT family N-acetyltransferase [Streptococcus oricebi]|uniref:N-acetyltransferase n=1 Tax=Streptococcus oricebi TaxID=1547447 RepID=A0ABS5B2U0_9STRE|nr:GNAT family N-acetyltransferase [Streptococcus oricebi]MBP2623144.1 N-acetyltransferase [Streptococcus oricebi]